MKVLIVEDDAHTRAALSEILEAEGYGTVAAADGREALAVYRREKPDVVCLDIMMPALSGYDVCREIRRADARVPILFISAKSEEVDKVLGLELGADDYIVKPFGRREVIARIRAVTRRLAGQAPAAEAAEPFRMHDLRIVPSELRAYRGKDAVDLSLRDVKILALFHRSRGKVLDRDTIFDACWGGEYFPNSRTLDQHISQLRKKIERDPAHPIIIRTVHHAGYRYEE
jgi:DNA-binding response OmpR family regulator